MGKIMKDGWIRVGDEIEFSANGLDGAGTVTRVGDGWVSVDVDTAKSDGRMMQQYRVPFGDIVLCPAHEDPPLGWKAGKKAEKETAPVLTIGDRVTCRRRQGSLSVSGIITRFHAAFDESILFDIEGDDGRSMIGFSYKDVIAVIPKTVLDAIKDDPATGDGFGDRVTLEDMRGFLEAQRRDMELAEIERHKIGSSGFISVLPESKVLLVYMGNVRVGTVLSVNASGKVANIRFDDSFCDLVGVGAIVQTLEKSATGEPSKGADAPADSGKRTTFATGAMKDGGDDRLEPTLGSPYAEERLAGWLKKGAKKYKAWNYAKGMPMNDILDSISNHVRKLRMRMDDEDHAAAIACQISFYLHTDEMIRRGKMDAKLDNRPDFERPETL